MSELTLIVAFIAGLVSFLSPCVLPIIPGFLAYLAGVSSAEAGGKRRWEVFFQSVWFVLGFSAVFAILGVLLNTLLERVAYDAQIWLARGGGAIIIFFGLYLTRVIKIPALEKKHAIKITKRFSSRSLTSFLFGSAFAAGWTPCVGAALGGILGLAVSDPSRALYLLFAYGLGLGIPFLLVGLFTAQANAWIQKHVSALKYVSIVFGIILIILGVLIFTQNLNRIASFELLNKFLLR